MTYKQDFEADCVYHIYTHGNSSDLLFREKRNYYFFLQKITEYILPIADILAYCLIPNHFHLIVRFKSTEKIREVFLEKYPDKDYDFANEHKFLMQQFSNCLNSYTKSFNKVYGRKGTLFINFLKRKKIEDEKYLLKCLHYVHNNPVQHGLVNAVENWEFSSYDSYLKLEKPSKLDRHFMLNYFDSVDDFVRYHKSSVEFPFLE